MQPRWDQPRQAQYLQQPRCLRDLRCQLCLGRIDHRSPEQEVHQLHRDGIHHHGAQDLVDVEIRF
jgi:hypothetical protein